MTDTPDAKLLPCPWCGGPASVEHLDGKVDPIRYSVGCSADEPLCMGYQSLTTFATAREAIAAWNTRPQPAPGEGEPDVICLARNIIAGNAADCFDETHMVLAKAVVGLASRTKVEDAELNEALTALRQLTMLARTSGGVAGRDAGLCAACDVAEAVLAKRTVDSVTHWMNGYAEMCQRAEAAGAKLAATEAELADAEGVINAQLGPGEWQDHFHGVRDRAVARCAARQQKEG